MEYSRGNKKIGRDTAIINFTSALECPSRRRGLCRVCQICYARKAERQYPAVLPYRRRQARQWQAQGIERIARELPALGRIKYVRFSEAGDFSGQRDVEKLGALARIRPDLVFYGYTARRDLDFRDLPANVVVNGSAFPVHNTFTAVPAYTPGAIKCQGNCRRCNLCKARRGIKIEVLNH